MANTLVTPTWVTKEVARGYLNNLKFVSNINRSYSDEFRVDGAKVGQTINVRLPQRFTPTYGQALQVQALYDQTVPLTLSDQINVGFGWSSAQATTELDDIRSRYVTPAADSLANAADVLAFTNVYLDVPNAVGTPGTTPSSTLTYLQAGVYLTDQSAPMSGRKAVLEPMAMATIANASATLFNPSATISENYKNGMFGRAQLGIDEWYFDQNVQTRTTGTFTASTPLVNNAGQTGSSLVTDGWASGATTLKKGDKFTIGGVYSVNPQSYSATPRLQRFVVTADVSDTTGDMTIPIYPPIITSGQLQTVSASPANNAVITVLGATAAASGTLATTVSACNMVFHPDAFAFVNADLVKPGGGAMSEFVRSKQFGISIRWVEQYQIGSDQNPSRFDILCGAGSLQPSRLACVVEG